MQRAAAFCRSRTPCRPGRSALRRALLLATTALGTSLLIAPAHAQNLPTGGSVAAGSVSVAAPTPTQLNIMQTSQSAVVNWQSFSVGQGYSVNIQQPNSTSALLNRVTGNAPSTIAGSITANGQVYLVNPNGIAITSTGVVNTGGFVASTLGISDSDFMAGKRTFAGTGASADVSNAGTITVGRGGYAALIGGTVENTGNIVVPLGKVGLGSGERATLDFSGDGFLQVAVPTKAGSSDALIRNSGTIRADGGSVIISAATAREAARNAVNISGIVQARTIGGRTGSISIGGGEGGAVKVTGSVTATARKTTGGAITVTGQDITLEGATLDASGKTGGGTINIGGGRQGQGSLQHADTLTVDAATAIRADATASGNGGNIMLWSDQITMFAGTITARGGFQNGNGGDAEVSGKAKLGYTGFTDLSAANGTFGTLLLDPYNVTISAGTNNTGGSFSANTNDSIINATTLQTALGSANVTVSSGSGGAQAGNITVAAPLTWAAATRLTLNAAGAIAINAPISINGAGGLAITASAQSGITTTGLTFDEGVSVTYAGGGAINGQSFSLNGLSYTLVYSMAQLDAIDGLNAVNGSGLTIYGAGLTGRYALATDLTATGTTYTRALIGTNSTNNSATRFFGRIDGLGHTITGLTINAPSTDYVGLIGYFQNGSISNVGLVGGSVIGHDWVGPLIGDKDFGVVQNSFAKTNVTGNWQVGGLIGMIEKMAVVQSSYATGTVTGVNRSGGFVGAVDFGAIVRNSYATGAVNGVSSTGGFAGYYSQSSVPGSIETSFSTGAVSGGSRTGGLVGEIYAGSGATVTASYWDTNSSGVATSAGGTGLTTAQLQGTEPSGFSTSVWATTPGQYPSLIWRVPAGVPQPPVIVPGNVGTIAASYPSSAASTLTNMIQSPGTNSVIVFMPVMPISSGAGNPTAFGPGTSLFYVDERFGQ
ncbi:MAG: filamentous hemagglutinin N-terminal protein [Xanthobacteraceae bacterium]|nr:filamentous hemagglutinin N-terminal protein [Xanthobacteraceae bacterium]